MAFIAKGLPVAAVVFGLRVLPVLPLSSKVSVILLARATKEVR